MNTLLIYFAFPVAIIIFSIALQKILRCPLLVSAVIFAILLIVTFAIFDETFLVAVIVYTILSYLTAYLMTVICARKDNCSTTNNFNNCNMCRTNRAGISNQDFNRGHSINFPEDINYSNSVTTTKTDIPNFTNAETLIDTNFSNRSLDIPKYNPYEQYCENNCKKNAFKKNIYR